jgi:hypothetical protein
MAPWCQKRSELTPDMTCFMISFIVFLLANFVFKNKILSYVKLSFLFGLVLDQAPFVIAMMTLLYPILFYTVSNLKGG